jgi:hypothetical protein
MLSYNQPRQSSTSIPDKSLKKQITSTQISERFFLNLTAKKKFFCLLQLFVLLSLFCLSRFIGSVVFVYVSLADKIFLFLF